MTLANRKRKNVSRTDFMKQNKYWVGAAHVRRAE